MPVCTAESAAKHQFYTEAGIPVPAVTAEQMREVDRIAVEETGPNLYQMMENAGRNLAFFTIELLGRNWPIAKVVVLADAEFDSERNHTYIRQQLGAQSVIPAKRGKKTWRVRGVRPRCGGRFRDSSTGAAP